MNLFRLTIIFVAALAVASCSKRSTERDQDEAGPEQQDIGEDCVAFLRATVAKRSDAVPGQCPVCPSSAGQTEVLRFVSFTVEQLSHGTLSCEATVRIHALFNPSNGGTISGGLVGWIPLEQRERYARGESPAGEQVYDVKITYQPDGQGWRPVEFDRR